MLDMCSVVAYNRRERFRSYRLGRVRDPLFFVEASPSKAPYRNTTHMATTDISALIDYYVREKDLTRECVLQALEASFLTAYSKMVPGADRIRKLRAVINPQKGTVKIKAMMTIVDDAEFRDPYNEIKHSVILASPAAAEKNFKPGDTVSVNVTPKDFGRIAVQTARQTMQQRIRKAEQEMLADNFRGRLNEVVTGTVRRYEKGDVIVEVDRFEGVMPQRERIPGEEYSPGDKMRFLVKDVREDRNRGTKELILSRSSGELVRRLFESEVAEIADHTISIVTVVREPGYRSKLVVRTSDPNVDPIGACVGIRGVRVKNVVNELNHEKIDILEYTDDKASMVLQSLDPINPLDVIVDEKTRKVTVVVEDDRAAAKAKGRRGQNVRLTGRLISAKNERWEVLVVPHDAGAAAKALAKEGTAALAESLGISVSMATRIVQGGFTTVEQIADSDTNPADLAEAAQITEDEAGEIIAKARSIN